MKKVEGFTGADKKHVEKIYKQAILDISKTDVKYVLDKIEGKSEFLKAYSLEWMQDFGKQVELLSMILEDWWKGIYDLPWKTVATITAALYYFISPFDLLPDFEPLTGYLDDAYIVRCCIKKIEPDIKKYTKLKQIKLKKYSIYFENSKYNKKVINK